mgnify:CR=1 FL=1
MKKYFFAVAVFCLMGLIYSCTENPVINAEVMDADELKNLPGFSWYEFEINQYIPLDSSLQSIKTKFNPSTDNFLIYVKPSCACTGTYKQFPAFMKIINELNIPKANYKVYSMTSEFNEYPEKNLFKIVELPTFMLMRNGVPVYSIADTFNLKAQSTDSLRLEQVLQTAYKQIQ